MAKVAKKKNVKLRRRIRKTAGAICLITALLVAAIPIPGASAQVAGEHSLQWVTEIGNSSVIPLVPEDCTTIYTTEDGMFQFAWVRQSSSSTNMIAVILGYNAGRLEGNALRIPDTVDAYTKYNENDGTGTGYIAVGQNQKPLFYMSEIVWVTEPTPGNGNVGEIDYEHSKYLPCYSTTRRGTEGVVDGWGYTDANKTVERDLSEFYYLGDDGRYHQTETADEQWIRNVTVAFIGNQYLTPQSDEMTSGAGAQQEWKVASGSCNTIPDNGIFAGQKGGNITYLEIGPNLLGIGNFAFYNCTTLQTITVGNGIQEIGHNAFDGCHNMATITFEGTGNNMTYIADETFKDCWALDNFKLPPGITRIFDNAFENCTNLTNVDLDGISSGMNTALNKLGYHVFKGCTSLQELILPVGMTGTGNEALHLNNFEGCSNLRHILVNSTGLQFRADEPTGSEVGFSVDNFKATVHSTFYFEAEDVSGTHNYTKEHAIPFKYKGEDRYEVIIIEKGLSGEDVKLTYQVNSKDELLYFNMEAEVEEVTIPTAIGPYGVSTINEGSFSSSCYLKKITIPGTVTSIGANAFKGCHELTDVIWLDAGAITYIGDGAFSTQVMIGNHHGGCQNKDHLSNLNPKLTFTGAISKTTAEGEVPTVPFSWAMNGSNYINAGSQNRSYVTYYSGWPTNLEVQYVLDRETNVGAATLVDYPTFADLQIGGKYVAKDNLHPNGYPYITADQQAAAADAIEHYQQYRETGDRNVLKDDEWDIIDAALNVKVPVGVKRIATGLFSGVEAGENEYEVNQVSGKSPDTKIQSVTFADIEEFEPYSFSGCTELTTINITGGEAVLDDYAFAWAYTPVPVEEPTEGGPEYTYEAYKKPGSPLTTINMSGGGSTIGDYAFANNYNLTKVTLSATVSELGLRPFKDCSALYNVDFSGGPYFKTDTCIIYGLDAAGDKKVLVECLESRGKGGENYGSSTVSATETAGITELRSEAFMNCDSVGEVDFRSSNIETVPVRAFADTDNLYAVYLPNTCYSIGDQAFHDSALQRIGIPRSVSLISLTAFNHKDNPRTDGETRHIDFYTELELPKCAAVVYAENYDNIDPTEAPDSREFTVSFWYYDYRVEVEEGEAPPLVLMEQWQVSIGTTIDERLLPTAPDFTAYGYKFVRWTGNLVEISMDTNITAYYQSIDSAETQYTVRYWLDTADEEPFYTAKVDPGADAPFIQAPAKEGYTFVGWSGRQGLENIQGDLDVYAKYELGNGTGGGTGDGNGDGTGGDGTGGNGNGNGNGQNATFYTLTVQNGSGSGSYVAGASVPIIANAPASTQEFSKWTPSNSAVTIASLTTSATILTMPAENLTVTASYTNRSGSGNNGNGNNGNNGSNGGNGSGGSTSGGNKTGTVIVIDKNGLSNTGVVSATIRGSSDNFVIKITDDANATEQILNALLAEYGSLDNLKYFPMDISLYDSTGERKITDTSGLSISITLPLPDSLINYAGNNQVAGVVNGRLDKLSPRFTTIDGVPCITFIAEHFSPYVIYVDTSRLGQNMVVDNSPQTGDIHPKWFVALGLFSVAIVLFAKRDKTGKRLPAGA